MQRACSSSYKDLVAGMVVVVLAAVVWRSDAAQSGRNVTSACNAYSARSPDTCSDVGAALSILLGRGSGEEVEGVLEYPVKGVQGDPVCSGEIATCCSSALQGDLAMSARDEFHHVFVRELTEHLPQQCQSMDPAVLRRIIREFLSEYITFQTHLISASVCTINTLAYGFEDFATSIASDTFLNYTKEEILRLYFNVMVDFFNIRIQDPIHYKCVRDYVENTFGEQIDLHVRQSIVFLAKLQLLLKISQELSTFYEYLCSSTNWLSSSCVNKLAAMTYCRVCSGYVCFKPCRPYCLDTIGGCITGALSGPLWDAVELLRVLTEDIHSSSDTLLHLANHTILEYLPSLEENAAEISKELRQCQDWRRIDQSTEEVAVPPSGASEVLCHSAFNKSPSRVPNLQAKLSGLALPWVDCFSAMLPSATSLERDICQSEEYSGLGYQEWNCWNGTHLGRYSKQAERSVADHEVHLTDEQAALSLAVWRTARALDALNSCSNSSQCITAYSLSLELLPAVSIIVEEANDKENKITAPEITHQWEKTPQLVLVRSRGPPLLNHEMAEGATSAPVSSLDGSETMMHSSGQYAVRSVYLLCLLLVFTVSIHLF